MIKVYLRYSILVLFLFPNALSSQELFIGISGGLSNYQGDLLNNISTLSQSRAVGGIYVQLYPFPYLSISGGFNFAKIGAADKFNVQPDLRARNLSFVSNLQEGYLTLQIDFFNYERIKITPYIFGGVALFHYNPYTYDTGGEKVFLHSLTTEAQGSPAYPEHPPYKLTNYSLPFGGGFTYHVTKLISVGAQLGFRKTFTDYLDDVSTTYPDQETLLQYAGQKSVELTFRGDELNSSAPYPSSTGVRGDPNYKDWYYFTVIKLGVSLSGIHFKTGGKNFGYGNTQRKLSKKKISCPKF